MSAPRVFHERSLWYESDPSVLTTARKCATAKDSAGVLKPIKLIYLPQRQFVDVALPAGGVERRPIAPESPHQTTADEVKHVRDNAGLVGLYTEVRWFPTAGSVWTDLLGHPIVDPIVFRKAVSKELLDLYKLGDPVMFDWEKLPSPWIIEFLLGHQGVQGWRGKDGNRIGGANPWRESAWTDASFQIGNYSDELLSLLSEFGFAFFPQLYYGGMQPVNEREDAMREPRDRGFGSIDVFPMYDADANHQPGPNNWRKGCLFTSNRWSYLFAP